MAFKWKYPTSTLDEDLEVSSSSDEEVENILRKCPNEDELLRVDDDEVLPSATGANASIGATPFFMDTTASTSKGVGHGTSGMNDYAGTPVASIGTGTGASARETGGNNEAGKIVYDAVQGDTLSHNTSKNKNSITDLDLDEICRQRNILPPPRAPRHQAHHRFHHDRPITGARGKFYNIDPAQNLSLDEIIKMTPPGGRDHQAIRRRQHFRDGNWQYNHHQQTDKLKKGVETIAENHPEQSKNIFEDAFPNRDQQHGNIDGAPDPWHCISILINKGYNIFWSLMKLKNFEYLTEDQETRLYRCVVSYNHVHGICEAGTVLQAKHGAAADFLEKLPKEFPLLGKFTIKLNESILLDSSLLKILISKLKEKHGDGYKFQCQIHSQKLNNRNLYKCTLYMESSKYEGCSFLHARAAKLMAAKLAYEDLLKEPCPMQKIHVGQENCTGDQSLYRGVDSQIVHCYDFSRATIIDPEAVRTSMSNSKKSSTFRPFQHHGKAIQVSFVNPK